jgi:hypothetical protein
MKEEPLFGPFAMERRLLDDWSNGVRAATARREHRAAALGAAGARLLRRAGRRLAALGGSIGLALREPRPRAEDLAMTPDQIRLVARTFVVGRSSASDRRSRACSMRACSSSTRHCRRAVQRATLARRAIGCSR